MALIERQIKSQILGRSLRGNLSQSSVESVRRNLSMPVRPWPETGRRWDVCWRKENPARNLLRNRRRMRGRIFKFRVGVSNKLYFWFPLFQSTGSFFEFNRSVSTLRFPLSWFPLSQNWILDYPLWYSKKLTWDRNLTCSAPNFYHSSWCEILKSKLIYLIGQNANTHFVKFQDFQIKMYIVSYLNK